MFALLSNPTCSLYSPTQHVRSTLQPNMFALLSNPTCSLYSPTQHVRSTLQPNMFALLSNPTCSLYSPTELTLARVVFRTTDGEIARGILYEELLLKNLSQIVQTIPECLSHRYAEITAHCGLSLFTILSVVTYSSYQISKSKIIHFRW